MLSTNLATKYAKAPMKNAVHHALVITSIVIPPAYIDCKSSVKLLTIENAFTSALKG